MTSALLSAQPSRRVRGGARNVDALRALRTAYLQAVWGGALPTTLPAVTPNADFSLSAYTVAHPANVSRLDLLAITLPAGGTAVGRVLVPSVARTGGVLIQNPGHNETANTGPAPDTNSMAVATAFLQAGWVVVQSGGMPTMGDNPNPLVLTRDAGGTISIAAADGHDFTAIEAAIPSVHPLRWFLDPAIQLTNHIVANLAPTRIAETGDSGGGFTTHYHAAGDNRVTHSAPLFGILPYQLITANGVGDWEQYGPSVAYKLTQGPATARSWWSSALFQTHEQISALGCYEPGRHVMDCNGWNDPDFPIVNVLPGYRAAGAYIATLVPPGQYSQYEDTVATVHTYTANAIAAIVAFAGS